MTEDRWRTSTDSKLLFEWLARPAGDRKSQLWFAACGRAIWPLLPGEHSKNAVEWLERHVEGKVNSNGRNLSWLAEADVFRFDSMEELREEFPDYYAETVHWIRFVDEMPVERLQAIAGWCSVIEQFDARDTLRQAADFAEWCLSGYSGPEGSYGRNLPGTRARFLNPNLLRCVFGNPYRPVAFSPSWRSESAIALARTAYDTRNFTLLPILADALEEAGCDHADILSHCRDPKATHARGCWVVDLVLGKANGAT